MIDFARRHTRSFALLVMLALPSACDSPEQTIVPNTAVVTVTPLVSASTPAATVDDSTQHLLAALRTRGFMPTLNGPSALDVFGEIPGRSYAIGVMEEYSGGMLYIHAFPDAAAAAAAIEQVPARIGRDGVQDWVSTPHLFTYETALVLLASQDMVLIQAVEAAGAVPINMDELSGS